MKSEKEQLSIPQRLKSMFKFIRGHKEGSEGFGIMKKKALLIEEKELSKLLSFENIKAKTFYQIQNQLILVKKSQKKEDWQKAMNLLGEASEKVQQKRWSEIVERYSREVDEESFNRFLKSAKKDIAWECDLVIMHAAHTLASLGFEEGFDALENIGIKGESIKDITQKIKGRITNHDLKLDNKKQEQEPINFFTMLAKIRKSGYQIDGNILLQEWCGVLNDLRETNERNNTKE